MTPPHRTPAPARSPEGSYGPPTPGHAPGYDGTTYYDRPSLKPAPFQNSVVGSYIFIAGLAGAAQLLATLVRRAGRSDGERVVRRGRLLSLLAPTVGTGLLIYDLRTPQRFYNMLRIFRRTSPMSIGTWLLMVFSASSLITAAGELLHDWFGWRWPRQAARAAELPAAASGAGLGTYTASLLSATSNPLWAAAPCALAVRFGSSSVASAAAALSMGERARNARLARDLDAVALGALLVELLAARSARRTWKEKGISAARTGWPALVLEEAGASVLGTVAPIALHAAALACGPRRESRAAAAASAAILLGSLALRVGTLAAGDESAARPQDNFNLASPRNLPGRSYR